MQVEDAVQTMEGSLMILRQSKSGWVVGFSIHPNEIPDLLLRVPLGTRYQIALVQIGDDEQPTIPSVEHVKSVAIAGQLCRNPEFQQWWLAGSPPTDDPERECAAGLRERLQVKSRSELATNQEARDILDSLIRSWKSDLGEDFNVL